MTLHELYTIGNEMIQLQATRDERHGSAYDRGEADSYYSRPMEPHYFVGDTYRSARVEMEDMTEDQVRQYAYGYMMNEKSGDKKQM